MARSLVSSVYSLLLLLHKSCCQGKYLNERNLELELLFIMLPPSLRFERASVNGARKKRYKSRV